MGIASMRYKNTYTGHYCDSNDSPITDDDDLETCLAFAELVLNEINRIAEKQKGEVGDNFRTIKVTIPGMQTPIFSGYKIGNEY